jgi:translation factor GUF1, mitochondrial
LIDSWFLKDKGVVMLIEIKQGVIKRGDVITSCAFDRKYDVFEVFPIFIR